MLNPSLAASGEDLDAVIQELYALQVGLTDEDSSDTRVNTGESKRKKPAARDLLATLPRKRISLKDIHFVGRDSPSGGAYGDVVVATFIRSRRGRRKKQRKVAVKKLRFVMNGDMTEEKFLRGFVNELHLLDKLSHPNIVKISGFVEDMENRIAWLVFPWEENGNLREFLLSGKWEIPERVWLIWNVASGLEYLHTREPPICHGDLKSLNVLVNSLYHAVITDFGSARIIRRTQEASAIPAIHSAESASHEPAKNNRVPQLNITLSDTALTLTGPACSLRWSPPEVLSGESLDLATDIWALGWIAWEAITDCYPFEELKEEWDITMKIIEGRLPMIYDHTQLAQIYPLCSLMQRCWKSEPRERPSATECNRTLKWIPNAIPVVKSGEGSEIRSAILSLQLGDLHRLQSRDEDASKSYKQGLAIARSARKQILVGNILLMLAGIDEERSKYVEAEASYSEALAIFESIGYKWGRANALRGLGHVQGAWSNFIEAEASYTQVLEGIGHNLGRASALAALGDIQEAQQKYVEAEASYTQALAIYESMGDDLARASVLVQLASTQQAQSNYVEAEALCTQALAIYESVGDDLGRANVLFQLADTQLARDKVFEAEASYTEALAIFDNIGNGQGRARVLFELGSLQLARFQYAEAEAFLTKALTAYESMRIDKYGQVVSSLGLAQIRLHQARYTESKALIKDALLTSEKIDSELGKDLCNELLEQVLESERSSTEPPPAPQASSNMARTEDITPTPGPF